MSEEIVFQVETSRVLKILANEIYDSPLALLRENLQNAYDAVRQRFAPTNDISEKGRIEITINSDSIAIEDNGIGMNRKVIEENFWKPGSSGKHSEEARKAGVVGTFGIGAMANFGVCSRVSVETRADGGTEVLVSFAEKEKLVIGQKCISLETSASPREIGTKLTAHLDSKNRITEIQATEYLKQYVMFLPVEVRLNGKCISKASFESRIQTSERQFSLLDEKSIADGLFGGRFRVHADSNGQVYVIVQEITMGGVRIDGSLHLVQSGGQLMGLRSSFGLAPIPVGGHFSFGGFANLSFLQPTAGREALSRESIEQVSRLIGLAEKATSEILAPTQWADKNNAFIDWILNHGRYELAGKISVNVLPDDKNIPLDEIKSFLGDRVAHYYQGTNPDTISLFSNESSKLLLVAQVKPRRRIQVHYLQNLLSIPMAPDSAQIRKIYRGSELSVAEASVTLKIASILGDDYLISDVEIYLAEISHGVTVYPKKEGSQLKIYIAKTSSLLPPLLEFYSKAYDLFVQFMKDFVRVHIYPRVQEFVPSSTRDGVDALRKILEQNRELYRYEDIDLGDPEGILGDYLSDAESFQSVLTRARGHVAGQSQTVSQDQVGTVEKVLEDVVKSPVTKPVVEGAEFMPAPPIIRDDVASDMKILMTGKKYPQLNNFILLLGLSDKLMKRESYFFRTPHTTKILWGGHRVIYIFTDPTGGLSLYYDIELRNQIHHTNTGGGMFPTTTIITKKRIYVPVPDALVDEFKVAGGPKEFFVRFDVLPSQNIS